jgi:hypothetical protein
MSYSLFIMSYLMNYHYLKMMRARRNQLVNNIHFNINCIHHKYHTDYNFNQSLCNFRKHYSMDLSNIHRRIKSNIILNHHNLCIQISIIHKIKFHFQLTNLPMFNFAINFEKFNYNSLHLYLK